jgi:predicted HD superfamily hydrolase involved in NAD metabolism
VILSEYSYVRVPAMTGDLLADVEALYLQNGREKTLQHARDVAATGRSLAARFGLDPEACERAGYLHDIANILRPEDMLHYARDHALPLDAAEQRYPFLLHQRLSATIAAEVFGVTDVRVLSAVAHHTTLKAEPSEYDMALFLADKISWDQEGTPPSLAAIQAGLEESLSRASLAYIEFALGNGMILCPHRWLLDARRWLAAHCGGRARSERNP